MNQYYPHLFTPLKVNNILFRNRIFAAPNDGTIKNHGMPTESMVQYFETRAKGGCAQVTLGEIMPDWNYLTHDGSTNYHINLHNEDNRRMIAEVATAIKMHGAVASGELNHPGACAKFIQDGTHAIGPMGLVKTVDQGYNAPYKVYVDAMDEDMIEQAVESFGKSAAVMQRTGFDMAMLHFGHGWLPSQFLSPLSNCRRDKWGGSLENRARFCVEIVNRIRKYVGRSFPLEVRVSGDELVEGGMPLEEVIEFIKMIEDKIDLVHVSAGMHDELETICRMFPITGFTEPGCNAYLAEAVKKKINLPVVAVGGINTPELAERIIANGMADAVSLGRALIADPDFPNKARCGHPEEIIPCLRCNECFESEWESFFCCSVNPKSAHEFRWKSNGRPDNGQKVAVIGGGPAGMEAAITAAERGHHVTLYEKEEELGGTLRFTNYDHIKKDLKRYMDFMAAKTMRVATVLLNTTATPELIEKEGFDAVVAAVGAKPRKPDIPGIEMPFVMSVIDAFYNQDKIGKNVVIIGGGMAACDIGMLLAESDHDIRMIEMTDSIADKLNFHITMPTIAAIDKMDNFHYFTQSRCKLIGDGYVLVEDCEGNEKRMEADTVLYAIGMVPLWDEALSFGDCADRFFQIGDCLKPAKIREATRGGYYTALDI